VHHLPSDSPIATLDDTAYFPMRGATLPPRTSVHHGHLPEITLTGPDTATAIWAMSDSKSNERLWLDRDRPDPRKRG
jgi:hypothetical protein